LPEIELQLSEDDGTVVLRAPDVGWFTNALRRGSVVAPGETAGVLTRHGASFELRVPAGAHGAVVSDPPDLVRAPVGYGDVLYRLAPPETVHGAPATKTGASGTAKSRSSSSKSSTGLALHAPQSGRFYHRPAPGEPAFVSAGAIVKDGQPVGMIEVMKTFSHVTWRATGGLPHTVRVVSVAAADGADVKAGDVLLELEPAPEQ
jgi:acetyl-CoA carboxylase biotin carboxyl carrier protein